MTFQLFDYDHLMADDYAGNLFLDLQDLEVCPVSVALALALLLLLLLPVLLLLALSSAAGCWVLSMLLPSLVLLLLRCLSLFGAVACVMSVVVAGCFWILMLPVWCC